MALHLPIGPLKNILAWNWYEDANPIPTSLLTDDLAAVPSRLVDGLNIV